MDQHVNLSLASKFHLILFLSTVGRHKSRNSNNLHHKIFKNLLLLTDTFNFNIITF